MTPVNPDEYAAGYFEEVAGAGFESVLVEIRRRQIVRWLAEYRARTVLEVGCGLRPTFRHVESFDAWTVVEPVPEFTHLARVHASGDARVAIVEGPLEERRAALRSENFDFIIVSSLLHEVADPRQLLRAVRSLCKPETVVHVNVPNARSFHRLLAVEMGLIDDPALPSERTKRFGRLAPISQTELLEMMSDEGFVVAESGSYFIKPFTHEQMTTLLESGAFPESLLEGLEGMAKHMPELGCEIFANARRT